jgi:hypothetical protein
MSDSPSATAFNGRLYCFYQGSGEDGHLMYSFTTDGSNWAEEQVPNVAMSAGPAVVVYDDLLICFYQGPGQDGQLYFTATPDGSNWTPAQQVPNVGMSVGPSACFG